MKKCETCGYTSDNLPDFNICICFGKGVKEEYICNECCETCEEQCDAFLFKAAGVKNARS